MELDQYTKKELVAMLQSTFDVLEYYANLEVSFVKPRGGGNAVPFALPQERRACIARQDISQIQSEALIRRKNVKPKTTTSSA